MTAFQTIIVALIAMMADPPQRVVSLNVCTDQLLIELLPPEQIAGVSYWAIDPIMSAYTEEAEGLRLLRGNAEEVIALEPDLVLAGSFSTRETVRILTRLGYEVLALPPANSFDDIYQQIELLGEALGQETRAEDIITEMSSRVEAASRPLPAEPSLFANYDANGWSTGRGTLTAEIAHLAGYRTLGDTLGFQGTRQINLEALITARPDVIDLGSLRAEAPALASDALKHPALDHLMRATTRVDIPSALTACGTPRTVEAVEILSGAKP